MAQPNAKAKRSACRQKATKSARRPRKSSGARKVASRHNYLPFFRKEKDGDPSWWNVKPQELWEADLKTGREYARIFSPNLRTSAGGPMLGWIVDGMVKAAKSRKGNSRVIDGIASGFLMELVSVFQQAHLAVAIAQATVEKPDGVLAAHFKSASADGSLLHEPKFKMLEINKPAKGSDCWHGMAVSGMDQYEWFYWPDGETLRANRFVVQPNQRICDGQWMERAPIPDDLRRDVTLAVLLTQEGLA